MVLEQQEQKCLKWNLADRCSLKRGDLVHNRGLCLRCVQCVSLCESTFLFFTPDNSWCSLDSINGVVFPCIFHNCLFFYLSPLFRFLLALHPKLLTSYTHALAFFTYWGRCCTNEIHVVRVQLLHIGAWRMLASFLTHTPLHGISQHNCFPAPALNMCCEV